MILQIYPKYDLQKWPIYPVQILPNTTYKYEQILRNILFSAKSEYFYQSKIFQIIISKIFPTMFLYLASRSKIASPMVMFNA